MAVCQGAGTNEPSIIASSLGHAEKLGLEPAELDNYLKQIAAVLFAGNELHSTYDIIFDYVSSN
jgi:hypothetical protein